MSKQPARNPETALFLQEAAAPAIIYSPTEFPSTERGEELREELELELAVEKAYQIKGALGQELVRDLYVDFFSTYTFGVERMEILADQPRGRRAQRMV